MHDIFLQVKEAFQKNNTFLLTTHVNPDADAIGSVMAVSIILRKLGKTVRIINTGKTPAFLRFLDTEELIEVYSPDQHDEYIASVDCIVVLDLNRIDRVVRMERSVRNSPAFKICIDHHLNPEPDFGILCRSPEYCATAHLLYHFIEATKIIELSTEAATALYSGIMTDTGSFRFDRTTPEVHRIAASLLEHGVQPHMVYGNIYDTASLAKIRLQGVAIQSLQLFGKENELGVFTVRQESFVKYGAVEDDTESLIHIAMSLASVKLALFFVELPQGFKVSLRSKGDISVNEIAKKFGGGGHKNASGIRIRDAQLDDMKDEIINFTLSEMTKNTNS